MNDPMPIPFLGTIYTRLAHVNSKRNRLHESLQYNKKALLARLQAHQQEEANSSLINLSGSYFDLDQKDSAWKYMDEGLYLARKFSRKNLIENGYYILYNYYLNTRDFKNALDYFQQYQAIGDSIQQDKTRSEIVIVEASQRIQSIEGSSELLLKQNEIQRLNLRNQKNQLIFLQILTGFSIIIMFVFLWQYMINFRGKRKLQSLNEKLSREIHDREITQDQIRDREKKYRFIAEHTVDLVTRINQLKQCVYASPSAEKIFGYTPSEILEEIPYGLTHPAFIEYAENQFMEMIRERKPVQFSYLSLRKGGETFWAEALLNPVFDEKTGEFREVVSVMRDIQELKNKEMEIIEGTKQKENLLKEIHHRVKNNFAILVSLINMQKDQTKNPELIQSLTNLQLRIRTMALVHEMLYRSKDFEKISFTEYLRSLSSVITGTYDRRKIQLHFDVEEIVMDIEASIPLGLIVNEILSNAYKHAFPDDRSGNIWICLKSLENGNAFCLDIRDDGIGIPEQFSFENCTSMGLQIVQILVKQIEGEVILINRPGSGFIITFPKNVN
jgi:PAS domain S-box-containing protein